jgi:hypothetical protein
MSALSASIRLALRGLCRLNGSIRRANSAAGGFGPLKMYKMGLNNLKNKDIFCNLV